jgi:hypothetical protein
MLLTEQTVSHLVARPEPIITNFQPLAAFSYHPLCWSPRQLKQLADEHVEHLLLTYQSEITADFEAFRRCNEQSPSLDEYTRVYLNVLTRSLQCPVHDCTTDKTHICLVPVVDLFNHDSNAGAYVQRETINGRTVLAVRAARFLASREEICLDYGLRDELDWFLTHGLLGLDASPAIATSGIFVAPHACGEGGTPQLIQLQLGIIPWDALASISHHDMSLEALLRAADMLRRRLSYISEDMCSRYRSDSTSPEEVGSDVSLRTADVVASVYRSRRNGLLLWHVQLLSWIVRAWQHLAQSSCTVSSDNTQVVAAAIYAAKPSPTSPDMHAALTDYFRFVLGNN